MKAQSSSQPYGFTLIELMVVIVIISLIASLVVLNIGGVSQRKAMQAREILIMDLKRIMRESNDQGQIIALVTQRETDVSPFQYHFERYQELSPNKTALAFSSIDQAQPKQRWHTLGDQYRQQLPEGVSFQIAEQQNQEYKNANQPDLLGGNAPKLIWLGNGEAKPVSIQMYLKQEPVGGLIQVDYLGKVIDES